MRFLLIVPLLLVCVGCPATPTPITTQPSTQPVVDQQQQILNLANQAYQFSKALLNDLHAQGTISNADWTANYAPAIAVADTALTAWQTNIDQPGSVAAQAQFAAAAADVALLVIQHMKTTPAALSQSAQKLSKGK